MLFNSIQFLLFFPIITILYWISPHKYRNTLLLIASYYFYMNWEPVYAIILFFSTITTWTCSLNINRNKNKSQRKKFFIICILINLSILFTFKYLHFASNSIFEFLNFIGLRIQIPHFKLLLPVGISFYTFQAIGYTIDVYKKKIEPEKNFFTYALFISFFPQLVAGPIERATNLLPQFHRLHKFNDNQFIEGFKMMIWGYFMKLCIAGNVSPYVDAVFNNVNHHNGTSLLLASFLFTFQIYCDFGGYSLIAIGTAKCLGFNLMQNFNHPYLSRSMSDFWKRWHISLSSWFMEYVYIPLGGNRCSTLKHYRNLLTTMIISGIWHGANWTFILWGGLHGIFLICNKINHKLTTHKWNNINIFIGIDIFICFILIMFSWIFFRANSLRDIFTIYHKIFLEYGPLYYGEGPLSLISSIALICLLLFKDIKDEFHWKCNFMHNHNYYISTISTAFMIILILLCANFESGKFIYFQF